MLEDTELLRRYAADRSEAAFAEFVQRHINLVYSAALRRTGGDAHAAADVAQQVFLAAARNVRSLARHPRLTGWLYAATRNAALNLMRDEHRRQQREREAQAASEFLASPVDDANWQRLRPVLDEAMDKLDDADREAVLLRFFANRSFAEVGAKLNLSENTARMRVERALEKLHALLATRGVTSTSSALAAVLANQAAANAPVGLAANVTGAALSGAAAAGAGSLAAVIAFMSASKISVSVAVAVIALLALGTAGYQLHAEREAGASLARAEQQRTALAARWRRNKRQPTSGRR
ncbi:MAG: sigma-70 family RNA polymerase sigma factor [Opitutus sp.]|nr:sigma-70 family RNA polymerase sigma factor [Opitutus sp.]